MWPLIPLSYGLSESLKTLNLQGAWRGVGGGSGFAGFNGFPRGRGGGGAHSDIATLTSWPYYG